MRVLDRHQCPACCVPCGLWAWCTAQVLCAVFPVYLTVCKPNVHCTWTPCALYAPWLSVQCLSYGLHVPRMFQEVCTVWEMPCFCCHWLRLTHVPDYKHCGECDPRSQDLPTMLQSPQPPPTFTSTELYPRARPDHPGISQIGPEPTALPQCPTDLLSLF